MKALSLTKVIRKNEAFIWEKEQQDAFEAIKRVCIKALILIAFCSNKLLRMKIDVSDITIKAYINQ